MAAFDRVKSGIPGLDNALDNIDALPDQTNNSGKYLVSDGTTASWQEITNTEIVRHRSIHYPANGTNTVTIANSDNVPDDVE
jgi:hypothetical protein